LALAWEFDRQLVRRAFSRIRRVSRRRSGPFSTS
jgi:hypothetical protein